LVWNNSHWMYCENSYHSICFLFLHFLHKVFFYGDEIPSTDKSALVIANHLYYCDWLVFYALAYRMQRAGWIKVIARNILRNIPALGTLETLHRYLLCLREHKHALNTLNTHILNTH
jgi:1-acyl-sn-glycerol-3-phosphate acyltransferase